MEQLTVNHYLVVAGIIAIITELALGAIAGFELLVLGVIFVISGVLGILSGSFPVALVSVIVLTLLYVFFGRRTIRNRFDIATKATNIDAVIGAKAQVIKSITPHTPGQVKVDGEIWRAVASEDIAKGEMVKVHSVSGVTLTVAKIS
ncbi:MAG: NfeD family protein [Patescibacteria group bacterium]|nr:NfeD family protein [Patescibacteria group bacterium]